MKQNRFSGLAKHSVPNIGTCVVVAAIVLAGNAYGRASASPNAPDLSTNTISYQGRIANAGGTPLTGNFEMTFRLYSQVAGGTALWTEAWVGGNSVRISDGLFNVLMGSLTPMPQSVFMGNSNLWLGIKVGNDAEMTPRVQLGSVPFATQALTVPDGSITTAKIADGAVTSAKLSSSLPRLLGHKTCYGCTNVTESIPGGVTVFKGATLADPIEVTLATTGRPLLISLSGRYYVANNNYGFCYLEIANSSGTVVWQSGGDGISFPSPTSFDWSCSGSQLVPSLPAGTYTFRISVFTPGAANVIWLGFRQIAVFEF